MSDQTAQNLHGRYGQVGQNFVAVFHLQRF